MSWGEWSLVRDHSMAVLLIQQCMRMVSNQTAFPSTSCVCVGKEMRQKLRGWFCERRWEIDIAIERVRAFDFDLAMHRFSWALIYIRERHIMSHVQWNSRSTHQAFHKDFEVLTNLVFSSLRKPNPFFTSFTCFLLGEGRGWKRKKNTMTLVIIRQTTWLWIYKW